MDEALRALLLKQQYRLVGEHSGVKICHWMRQKLYYDRPCYKERFYGIATHRCLQMTPTVDQCNLDCLFCWRAHGDRTLKRIESDEPELILNGAIEGQRKLLTGYKGDMRCNLKYWEEAQNPNQVAISLAGEPTIYPYLSDFIELCHRNGMTTFLVTNGTFPKALEKLDTLPTQLYVTVAAPSEEIYAKLCQSRSASRSWKNLRATLELLPNLSTRTVIRHTLLNGWNLTDVGGYAALDALAEPDFIEPKGYMFVGRSRDVMTIRNMPTHEQIKEFGEGLAQKLGYSVLDERSDSRVVLLGKDKSIMKINRNYTSSPN